MQDIAAKFLPRFVGLARERLSHARQVVSRRTYDAVPLVVRDLHAMAGEAGLLSLDTVLPLARRAETTAARFGASRTEDAARELSDLLEALERAVAAASLPPDERG